MEIAQVRLWISIGIPLLTLLSYVMLMVLVVRRVVLTRLRRRFVLYLAVMASWSLGSALMRLDPDQILLWNKVLSGSAILTPVAFFAFVGAFLDGKRGPWLWAGIGVGLVGLEVANVMGLMVVDVRLLEGGLLSVEVSPVTYLSAIFGVVLLGSSVSSLARARRRTLDPVLRNRIRYPMIGVLLVLLGGSSNALPALGLYPVDHAANLLNASLLAYAVFRYRLLDVRLAVRRGLLY
ncbi:MAG: histidine kinase N-terminal 7TM domain-containing protein, partial [Anaerolineae bacterium]